MFRANQTLTQELAFVESAFRVNALFVICKRLQLRIRQKLQLGDANAVLARNHAIQATRQHHDARYSRVRGLQHFVVVAVHRQVGMHIAITRMHVQSCPNTPFQDTFVNRCAFIQNRHKRCASEDQLQLGANIGFPAGTQGVVLELWKQRLHIRQPAHP